ncbi:uncharacterized protein EDB91DRAFT_1090435 [Suillus paluster]|uniref:uncharacterized protein n=1 Tax=Suillus paluster TaxID=48578 RepID=UPI001B87DF5C|nr:uncharacterized protein EDB91DRAFT_1090435 [Suillus paluster]KAG1717959.1 hypothetical protein EDB91DRAFT_1090435 [Suillus paluster]
MSSSAIAQEYLQLSSEDEVFDLLEPEHEERTYNDPLMDCSSMAEYILSAHDRWKDGKTLKMLEMTAEERRSLDMGFPLSDDDQMSDTLDMQFPTLSDDDRSSNIAPAPELQEYQMLDLGFPPESEALDMEFPLESDDALDMEFPLESDNDVFDMGFLPESGDDGLSLHPANSLQVSHPAGNTEGSPLEMGFDTDPVDHVPDIGNSIQPVESPLEMGFQADPVNEFPDQSLAVSQPDPIGFVIQRAVGDLQVAVHRLEMDRDGGAISPEEAFAREQVLGFTRDLLLACQLISIPQLST